MKNILNFTLLFLFFASCAYNVKEPVAPIYFIKTFPLDTTKIRSDGFYTNSNLSILKKKQIEFSKYTSQDLVVFANSKKIVSNYYVFTKDKETFLGDYFKEMVKSKFKKCYKKIRCFYHKK